MLLLACIDEGITVLQKGGGAKAKRVNPSTPRSDQHVTSPCDVHSFLMSNYTIFVHKPFHLKMSSSTPRPELHAVMKIAHLAKFCHTELMFMAFNC